MTFGRLATLESADITRLWAAPGDEIDLMLRWRQELEWGPGYSSFVHLRDENWDVHAQADNWLEDALWKSGSAVLDAHVLTLPAHLAAGVYRLDVGVYRRRPYEPLLTETPDGRTHSLTLGKVEVRSS